MGSSQKSCIGHYLKLTNEGFGCLNDSKNNEFVDDF